jgi:hypothetical protein
MNIRQTVVLMVLIAALSSLAVAQTARQPKIAPGPNEPDWQVILRDRFRLSVYDDLLNPVTDSLDKVPGLFKKAGPGPVRFTPVIALGLETRNRGGWYPAAGRDESSPRKHELWHYIAKNTTEDLATGKNLPPPLERGSSTEFDPGGSPFGFWIANDGLSEVGVFTEPRWVARLNPRLAKQPYKAMIYPRRDGRTGKVVPHSYVIGWEYSTNDDFQDVVCQVDNAELIREP